MNTCECVCITRKCKQAAIARAMRCERRAAGVIKRENQKRRLRNGRVFGESDI